MRSCDIPNSSPSPIAEAERERILIVVDEAPFRRFLSTVLESHYDVREAEDGESALLCVAESPPDLVVMDLHLPGLQGAELLAQIRAAVPNRDRIKVLLVSGSSSPESLGGLAGRSADDFLAKPFAPAEFLSRIDTLLLPRSPHATSDAPIATVRIPAAALTRSVSTAPAVPTLSSEVLAFTISRLMADSNLLSEGHWNRVVRYVRALASAAPREGEYMRLQDAYYLDELTAVAPLYDLGQLAVPRTVLMKPDRLEPDERNLLQTHTTQGAEVLTAVAEQFGAAHPSLRLAVEVARSHHERWDGFGYPDRLVGDAIPLSARVVAIVAAYEAMRSRRPHRPPLSHARTVRILTTECSSQFDPILLAAFRSAADEFDRIQQGL